MPPFFLPSVAKVSCAKEKSFFLIYFFQYNPHTHTMEVTVIFSSNHRAVSDGTCVLNKTGRRTDVMLSGLCFSFFFFLSILLPLFLFSPSVGCYTGYFCFKIYFFPCCKPQWGNCWRGQLWHLELKYGGISLKSLKLGGGALYQLV